MPTAKNISQNTYITSSITCGRLDVDYAASIHIGFGVDKKFIRPLGVALTSIFFNNTGERIVVHVFLDDISEENIKKLSRLAEKFNQTIIIYYLVEQVFDNLPLGLNWSKAIYYRMLIPSLFDKKVEKLLYMDADILCVGSIREIIDCKLGDNVAAVVKDGLRSRSLAERVKELKLSDGKYFNSGVMYINVPVWNKEDVFHKAIAVMQDSNVKLSFFDQDVLNMLLNGRVTWLSYRCNFQRLQSDRNLQKIPEDIIIFHYVGACKPWKDYYSEYKNEWMLFSDSSEWRDVPLIQPNTAPENSTEFRYIAMYAWHAKDFIKSIKFYWQYLKMKTAMK